MSSKSIVGDTGAAPSRQAEVAGMVSPRKRSVGIDNHCAGRLVDLAAMSDEEVEAYARMQERVSVRDRLCRYHGVRYVEELPATVQQKYFGRVLQHG